MSDTIVIAGGGTGGHVFVADSISQALVDRQIDRKNLTFIGSERGQERELLADRGIDLILLPGRGIRRSLSWSAMRSNVGAVVGIMRAFVASIRILRRIRPSVVVSVGGYAAAPVGLAAALLRRRIVLVNIDAVPGLAHKVLSRFAAASCVAFPGTPLARATVTGAPVRPEFAAIAPDAISRAAALAALGCDPDRPLVAILTGSLGARSVNDAVQGLADRWRQRDVTLYHVTGRRDAEQLASSWMPKAGDVIDYRMVPFEDQVPRLYQAADVAVTRAGALTVAELALAGLPAVLVPLPGAPGDHQTLNARALTDAGAGLLVADSDATAERLAELIGNLLDDDYARSAMAERSRSLGHPHAAAEAAEVVLANAD